MDMCEELDREGDVTVGIQKVPHSYARAAQFQSSAMMQSTDSEISIKSTSTISIPDVAAASSNSCVTPALSAAAASGRHAVLIMNSMEELQVKFLL